MRRGLHPKAPPQQADFVVHVHGSRLMLIFCGSRISEKSNDSPEKNAQTPEMQLQIYRLLKPVPRSCPGSMDPGEEAQL